MQTVATVVYDAVNPFELAVATEVFGVERPELGVLWYRFLVCGVEALPVRTSVGLLVTPSYALSHLVEAEGRRQPLPRHDRA